MRALYCGIMYEFVWMWGEEEWRRNLMPALAYDYRKAPRAPPDLSSTSDHTTDELLYIRVHMFFCLDFFNLAHANPVWGLHTNGPGPESSGPLSTNPNPICPYLTSSSENLEQCTMSLHQSVRNHRLKNFGHSQFIFLNSNDVKSSCIFVR